MKRAPSAASRSRFGVFSHGNSASLPISRCTTPRASQRWSSVRMTRMLGRRAAGACAPAACATVEPSAQHDHRAPTAVGARDRRHICRLPLTSSSSRNRITDSSCCVAQHAGKTRHADCRRDRIPRRRPPWVPGSIAAGRPRRPPPASRVRRSAWARRRRPPAAGPSLVADDVPWHGRPGIRTWRRPHGPRSALAGAAATGPRVRSRRVRSSTTSPKPSARGLKGSSAYGVV